MLSDTIEALQNDPDMPLAAYLDKAFDENYAACEWRTGYCEEAHFLTPLFHFTRLAKAHPDLRDLPADEALEMVEGWLKRKNGATGQLWKPFSFIPEHWEDEDARAEFFDLWDKIRFLPGETWLHSAWRLALGNDFVYEVMPICPTLKYAEFVALAAVLQEMRGSDPILLPVREVGELLRCTPMTISRCRGWSLKVGLLTSVTPFAFKSGGKGTATEFRFSHKRLEALLEDSRASKAESRSRESQKAGRTPASRLTSSKGEKEFR